MTDIPSSRPPASSPHRPIIRFGTDGWRAVMAEEFTFANVRRVAWALAQWIHQNAAGHPVYVGYDRRFGSRRFAEEAASVLAGAGVETRFSADVLPTPAFSYLCKKNAAYALVVTASHNPPMHNGLKIKTPDGASAPASLTREIEALVEQAPEDFEKIRFLADGTLRKQYLGYLMSFAKKVRAKIGRRKIVVDYFHGSGAGFLEEILGQGRVIALRKERDPEFGGIAPEPVEKNLEELKKTVCRSRAFLGVALDGDGDRFAMVDDKGRYLTPAVVFPMFVYYLALHRKEKGEIVQGVSLGYLGEQIASKAGLPFTWVPVGFKNIAERMISQNVLLGGEESGGYALGRALPDRDGSLNALVMLELLLELKTTPSSLVREIFKQFGASCYERFDIHLTKPIDPGFLKNSAADELFAKLDREEFRLANKLTIDGLKAFFEDGSWLLLRPSGTEPLVRVYAETSSRQQTRKLLEIASTWVREKIK
ncbi:MAG: phosphoglucomutase/phosphomannomutase family protein [Elusimicrobia bacterium]|nr:phosphoglucomutase/phosphomannomutase family protein [Elusimicrobiota bacterium]